MRAHVGRVLAALTVDELREVRERLDVMARDGGYPEGTASVAEVTASGEEVTASDEGVISGRDRGFEETVDDRSGWILERRGG